MTIIKTLICKTSGKEFTITERDAEFYKKLSPTFGDYKAEIPFPTLCPEERKRRRLSFRNERKLYRRICDATKQPIISIYSPDKPYKVFDQKIRWGDSWDGLDYGREFDFSSTFTEQFGELMLEVPRMSLANMGSENSDYCNPGIGNHNCYLCHCVTECSDSLYCTRVDNCDSCVDCLFVGKSQNCYNCISSQNCHSCVSCFNCEDCSFCINSYDLVGKEYYINNVFVGKELYEKYIKSDFEVNNLYLEGKIDENYNRNAENSTGKYLTNCDNCIECYTIDGGRDLKYSHLGKAGAVDCYDVSLPMQCERVLESLSIYRQNHCIASIYCRGSSSIFYSDSCLDSSNIFGCIGLRNKQYCIFNKQYTKEEYNILVPKIIEHMKGTGERGEFFDQSLSPFGYNETIAEEYLPLTESAAKELGYNRSSYKPPVPQSSKIREATDLPENIEELQEDILGYAIKCEESGKLFRLQPQEITFYRKHGISVPKKHPDVRHLERLALRR